MTDQIETPAVEAEHIDNSVNEIELKALNQGWRPKEQFQGDLDSWVPADEFIRRGDLLAEISKRGRENKDLQRQMALIEKQFRDVQQRAYEDALAKLRSERDMAIDTGDRHRVYDIEQKMAQVQKPEVTPNNTLPPEVSAFVSRNSTWFNDATPENTGFKAEAIAYEQALPQHLSVQDRLDKTEAYMKTRMYKAPKDPVQSTVQEHKPVKNTSKKTYESLSEVEKQVCDKFVAIGAFKSKQDYVDALVAQEKSEENYMLNRGKRQ